MIQRKAGRCPKSCVATFGPTPGPLLAHRSSASTQQRRYILKAFQKVTLKKIQNTSIKFLLIQKTILF